MSKTWNVRINYLFGCEFINVSVKANSERKARIRAIDKVKKTKGDHFMEVCCVELVSNNK